MSFGTIITLATAIHYPELPAGLILSEVDARFNKEQFLKKPYNRSWTTK
jgi:pimeloyl-ACP methyl ester carboxylesterase